MNIMNKTQGGILAGLEIALGAILMGFVSVYASKLAQGIVFSVGLCLVVLTQSKLFTGQVFSLANPVLQKKSSLKVMWAGLLFFWLTNYVGSFLAALALYGANIAQDTVVAFANIAQTKAALSVPVLFIRGILCNICVCLAVAVCQRVQTETAKIMMCIGCVTIFVACGFEHSVANMTFLTLGQLYGVIGLQQTLYNLFFVTLGNLVGGWLVVALFHESKDS